MKIQPYYAAYARFRQLPAEGLFKADGGRGYPYIEWIQGAWAAYGESLGIPKREASRYHRDGFLPFLTKYVDDSLVATGS